MGETGTHHFYDVGIIERVPEPQHQYYLSFETLGYLKSSKKQSEVISGKNYFWKLKKPENEKFWKIGKDAHRNIMTIRLIKSCKSLV